MAKAKVISKEVTGEELRKLRKKLGLNQHDFYSRLSVTQSGGSRYESGRPVPGPVSLLIPIVFGNDRESERVVKGLRSQ